MGQGGSGYPYISNNGAGIQRLTAHVLKDLLKPRKNKTNKKAEHIYISIFYSPHHQGIRIIDTHQAPAVVKNGLALINLPVGHHHSPVPLFKHMHYF